MKTEYTTRYIDHQILADELPRFLYHATTLTNYDKIYSDGKIKATPPKHLREFSEPNRIYLAIADDAAYSFVEVSLDELGVEDDIIIIQIDTRHPQFNLDKLYVDQNISYSVNEDIFSFEYRDDLSINTFYEIYEM